MSTFTRLIRRLARIVRRRRAESDLGDELHFHIEMEADVLRKQGMSAAAARAEAHRRFGGVDRYAEECRDERGGRTVEAIAQDTRYAFRALRHAPGFAAIVILTLGLAIGANAAIFSVVESVILRPLALPEGDQVVSLFAQNPDRSLPRFSVSYADFLDWQKQTRSFSGMAAFVTTSTSLVGDGEPERLAGLAVTSNLFDVLRVHAAIGRTFGPEDGDGAASDAVVLTDGFWRRRFAADSSIVGRRIQLGGRSRVVIGVLPPIFEVDGGGNINVITVFNPASIPNVQNHGQHMLSAIGRLKPGVSLTEAQQDLSAVATRLANAYPDITGWSANVFRFRDELSRTVRQPLLTLFAAAGLVLLIGCMNVANLLITRGTVRGRELALRQALGASRSRIVGQLVVESGVLAVGGAALGVGIAVVATRGLLRLVPTGVIPRIETIGVNGSVLAFALVLAVLTAMVVGVWPALRATAPALDRALREGARTSSGFVQARRARRTLVVVEVSLALALLVCSSLVIQSLWRILRVNPGFSPEQVVAMRLSLNKAKYSDSAQIAFYRELGSRLAGRPGIVAAAAANTPPISAGGIVTPLRPLGGLRPPEAPVLMPVTAVTPGYFGTMRIRVLEGRDIAWSDPKPTILVSESAARQFWPDEKAIGKRIAFGKRDTLGLDVVGVVPDVHTRGLALDPTPMVYLAYSGSTNVVGMMVLLVRSPGDLASVVATVKGTIRELDATLPLYNVQTVEDVLDRSVAQPRLNATLLTIFAAMALLLAALGIYGVVSYSVAQRTQELGVRLALGAQRGDVFRLVLTEGALLAVAGIALGLVGVYVATSAIQSWLFGIGRNDPATIAGVATALVGVAVVASLIPARRATRVDPLLAMRAE